MHYRPEESLYARDPQLAVELVEVHGYKPCICEGAARNVGTLKEAAEIAPAWARAYCIVHGRATPKPHDMATFPQAGSSYSCDPCKNGDHVRCQERIVDISWSNDCSCLTAAKDAHLAAKHEAKRNALAEAIYAVADGQIQFWLPTTDGTPNSASYAIADALIERHLAR